jgi:glycosyltransferase involved in cell wall biosynthesis
MMSSRKKIAIFHRYPPRLVVATNASFLEFLKRISQEYEQVYYVTYREQNMEPIEGVSIVRIPLSFNRWNNLNKVVYTYLWILGVPWFAFLFKKKLGFSSVYCDDSVPYYGFFIKLLNPDLKVVIRLGDLQSAYELADKSKPLFKMAQKFESWMWNKLDGIIPISVAMQDYLLSLGIPKSKLEVVEESINLDKMEVAPELAVNEKFEILFHGALVKVKGVETLLKAYKIFSQGKANKVGLIIAGGGPEEIPLKKLSSELKLTNVEFTGSYKTPEVLDEIGVFDRAKVSVVMRSSNFANNYVVTTCLLENWAHRKAVVVPNLQSFRSVVSDGLNGLFFEPDNAQDLANKLEYLYKNQEQLQPMGIQGYLTASKLFRHTAIADKMVQALKKLMTT